MICFVRGKKKSFVNLEEEEVFLGGGDQERRFLIYGCQQKIGVAYVKKLGFI